MRDRLAVGMQPNRAPQESLSLTGDQLLQFFGIKWSSFEESSRFLRSVFGFANRVNSFVLNDDRRQKCPYVVCRTDVINVIIEINNVKSGTNIQGGPKKVSHCNESSLNRIKARFFIDLDYKMRTRICQVCT